LAARAPEGTVTPSRLRIFLAYIGACLIWGSTWMMIKIGLRGAPPLTSIAVRMTIASLIVAVLIRLTRVTVPRDRRFVVLGIFLGIFQVALPYVSVYYGEQRISSGLAAVLYATFPLLVAVLAHAWLKNPLTVRKLAGVAAGIIGVAVIFSDNLRLGREEAAGTLMVMVSVTSSAFGSIATKKWGHGHHPIASLLIPFVTTAVVTIILALCFESPLQLRFSGVTWATMVYLAVAGSVSAFAMFFYVMQRLDVTVVSYQTFIIPIIAVLLGSVFLGEEISERVGLGAALILAGISLATLAGRPRE
jgi:drug/metabolite transporter (DMT)-like permease